MSLQDDPEARIQDLERSLADSARTAESNTLPYDATPHDATYPPPTASWSYDAPVPPRPPRRGLWAAVVVAAVTGLGVAIYLAVGSTSTTPGRPTFSGGGGGFPNTTAAAPTPALPAPTPTPTVEPGETLTVTGIDGNEPLHCDNNVVSVSGIDNIVTVTGHCAEVVVSGVRNVIVVDSTDVINVSGIENRVTYRFGAPEVNRSGIDNSVEQGEG